MPRNEHRKLSEPHALILFLSRASKTKTFPSSLLLNWNKRRKNLTRLPKPRSQELLFKLPSFRKQKKSKTNSKLIPKWQISPPTTTALSKPFFRCLASKNCIQEWKHEKKLRERSNLLFFALTFHTQMYILNVAGKFFIFLLFFIRFHFSINYAMIIVESDSISLSLSYERVQKRAQSRCGDESKF